MSILDRAVVSVLDLVIGHSVPEGDDLVTKNDSSEAVVTFVVQGWTPDGFHKKELGSVKEVQDFVHSLQGKLSPHYYNALQVLHVRDGKVFLTQRVGPKPEGRPVDTYIHNGGVGMYYLYHGERNVFLFDPRKTHRANMADLKAKFASIQEWSEVLPSVKALPRNYVSG